MERPAKTILSLFGLGYLPGMPGTWGSLGAALIYLALLLTPGLPLFGACLAAAAVFSVLTVSLGARAEKAFGVKDPSHVVTDEAAGYFLSAAFLLPAKPLFAAALAFFLFRFFDIVKPPPARRLEKLPGGWGVLLDDLAAGIYACAAGHMVLALI